jgi:uncharacterized protein
VRKYDGAEHRKWSARLIKEVNSLLVLDAEFDEHIDHELVGTIPIGTVSTEYYWLDRWYNVFRFAEPDGRLKRFYCNINMPPQFDGEVLSYIDLDIDVLVEPDWSFKILDVDDFEGNAKLYNYPAEIQNQVRDALAELVRLIETRTFPFTG